VRGGALEDLKELFARGRLLVDTLG